MKALKKVSDYFSTAILAGIVYAQDISIKPPEKWERLTEISVPGIISTAVKVILIVAAIVAFIFLVFGGIKWITSGGDKEGTQVAQKTITAALIGLIIVFAAWAIIYLLNTLFGIDIFGGLKIPVIPTG